jgi:hypothetical protein
LSGQGSGGGGALVLLLGLWLVAVVFVVSRLGDEPTPEAVPSVDLATPSPTPDLTFGIPCETAADCDAPATRAEMAGAIDSLLGLAPTPDNPFTDDDGIQQEAAINRMAAAGNIGGCGETTFCPDASATRAQLAAILVRSFGVPAGTENAFDDDDGHIHEAAIDAVAAAGFSGGCGERRFCPDDPVSRQELRDLLSRILEVLPEASAEPEPSA